MTDKQSASSHFDLIYGESLLPLALQNLPKIGGAAGQGSSHVNKIRDKPIRRPDNNTLNPHQVGKGRKSGNTHNAEEEKKHGDDVAKQD